MSNSESRWHWLFVLAAAGCGGANAAAPAASPSAPVTALERFLPLKNETVFSYETYIEETNERGLAVMEVSRPRDTLAELRIAGQVKRRYHITPEGIQTSTGGYALKAPLSVGAEWQGDDGKVRVTAMDRSVTVPAGQFSGCLETVEAVQLAATATRKTTTVYCPGVGITVLQIEGQQDGDSVLQRLSLKAFGPRFVPPAQ